jgi:hypothetical protein
MFSNRVTKEELKDTKGVIRIRKSKKNRQHNGRKTEEQTTQWPKDRRTDNTMAERKRYKKTNTDLQNIHINVVSSNPTQARCTRYNIM